MTGTEELKAESSSMAASGIRQLKRAMRKEMSQVLKGIRSEEVTRQSSAIAQHVLRHPLFIKAENVSVYVSMAQGEVQTEEVCREILRRGKKLYVPRFAASVDGTTIALPSNSFDSDMRMLRIEDWQDYEAMVMNRWGIREPGDTYREARRQDAMDIDAGALGLDLILVPGVAFDRFGGRLGHGKGYYDRYIIRTQQMATSLNRSRPSTVALALKEQVLTVPKKVPRDENDLAMDVILTAEGVLPTFRQDECQDLP